MDLTEDDQRTARLATALLVEDGRPDLVVSPEQVVRWRKADAIPVGGPRRGGRNQRTNYLPAAPAAATALALALDVDRNFDRAVLAAFGTGAPVAEIGVRAAADHVLREAENVFRRAYARRHTPRSEVPRPLRVPLRHSREAGASLVTDAILAPLLGEKPRAGKYGTDQALDELAGEATGIMTRDMRRRVEFVLGRFTFASLRQIAKRINADHWREATGWVAIVLEWGEAVADHATLTGSDPAAAGHLQPLIPVARIMRSGGERAGFAPGYVPTILGLMATTITSLPRRMRAARETAQAMAQWTPHFRALARLAADLPEHWRPTLAVGGAVYLASLPQADREGLIETIARWRSDHPAFSRALDPPTDKAKSLASQPDQA